MPGLDRNKQDAFRRAPLGPVLDAFEKRCFERQIRSEECGECTAHSILTLVDQDEMPTENVGFDRERCLSALEDVRKETQSVMKEILDRIGLFHLLPRVTEQILSLGFALVQARTSDAEAYDSGMLVSVSKALGTLATIANTYRGDSRWLAFCRTAEPVLRVHSLFESLRQNVAAGIVSSDLTAIKQSMDSIAALDKKQKEDKWVETLTKDENAGKGRRNKRIWSGGSCSNFSSKIGAAKLKVVTYSFDKMAVYSDAELKEGYRYEGMVHFNSVDMPLEVLAEVSTGDTNGFRQSIEKEVQQQLPYPRSRRQDLLVKGALRPYVLRFVEGLPKPEYYFLCMCKDLIAQECELSPDIFAELFCWDLKTQFPAALTRQPQ